MLRKVIQGIPFWLDTQNRIYAYDPADQTNPLWLGTYNPQTEKVELREDWRQAYATKIESYRQGAQTRSRVPPAAHT